jgi:hypothetical protein
MEMLINTLLVVGIMVAILALYGCLMLLFVWFIDYSDNLDYHSDIKDLNTS